MITAKAWELLKPFMYNIGYFGKEGMDFRVTCDDYALYQYQCAENYTDPVKMKLTGDHYYAYVKYNTIMED